MNEIQGVSSQLNAFLAVRSSPDMIAAARRHTVACPTRRVCDLHYTTHCLSFMIHLLPFDREGQLVGA